MGEKLAALYLIWAEIGIVFPLGVFLLQYKLRNSLKDEQPYFQARTWRAAEQVGVGSAKVPHDCQ